jgi:hypothetical protein
MMEGTTLTTTNTVSLVLGGLVIVGGIVGAILHAFDTATLVILITTGAGLAGVGAGPGVARSVGASRARSVAAKRNPPAGRLP